MPMNTAFCTTLSNALRCLGLEVAPDRITALHEHFELLTHANTRINLTRVTDPDQAAVRLYADSAAALLWAERSGTAITSVLDVGSGAGFPAVPLAVLAPRWRVTALEATGKKAAFLEQAARRLHLDNLHVVHAHSDHWPVGPKFDLVTFKAIGRLDACLKTARRFMADQGYAAIYKTATISADETAAAHRAQQRLGFVEAPGLEYQLPTPNGPAALALHVYTRVSQMDWS